MQSGHASSPGRRPEAVLAEQVTTELVLAEVRRVVAQELAVSRAVRPEDDLLLDLQLDSVGILTLVVGLEDRFRVALAEEDSAAVRTVADLAALIVRRAAEHGPGDPR